MISVILKISRSVKHKIEWKKSINLRKYPAQITLTIFFIFTKKYGVHFLNKHYSTSCPIDLTYQLPPPPPPKPPPEKPEPPDQDDFPDHPLLLGLERNEAVETP